MLFFDRGAEPCGLNLIGLYARVGQGFEIGLDHQFFRARVPAFAEFRASHSEDGDFVSDACGHFVLPLLSDAI
jgi:hypothetical protein